MNVNANSMVQHVVQIKNGIKHVNVNGKLLYMQKKIIVGILAYAVTRIVSI